jgi:hypothetical protein
MNKKQRMRTGEKGVTCGEEKIEREGEENSNNICDKRIL